jgi:hypothetical protein
MPGDFSTFQSKTASCVTTLCSDIAEWRDAQALRQIYLQNAVIDTTENPPFAADAETLALYATVAARGGRRSKRDTSTLVLTFLVTLAGGQQRDTVSLAGGLVLGEYIPPNTYVLRATTTQAAAIAAQTSIVTWVGYLGPAAKVHASAYTDALNTTTQQATLLVVPAPGVSAGNLAAALALLPSVAQAVPRVDVVLIVSTLGAPLAALVQTLAAHLDTHFIEAAPSASLAGLAVQVQQQRINAGGRTRTLSGAHWPAPDPSGIEVLKSQGLSGAGQTIAMGDEVADDLHPLLADSTRAPRVSARCEACGQPNPCTSPCQTCALCTSTPSTGPCPLVIAAGQLPALCAQCAACVPPDCTGCGPCFFGPTLTVAQQLALGCMCVSAHSARSRCASRAHAPTGRPSRQRVRGARSAQRGAP